MFHVDKLKKYIPTAGDLLPPPRPQLFCNSLALPTELMWFLSLSLRPAQGENVAPYQEEEDCSVWLCWLHFSVSSITQPIQSQRPPICTGLRVPSGQGDQFACLFFILARNKDADQGQWMLTERKGCPVRINLEETTRNLKENKGRRRRRRSASFRFRSSVSRLARSSSALRASSSALHAASSALRAASSSLRRGPPLRAAPACSQSITVDELLWMPNSSPEGGLGRGSVGEGGGGGGFPRSAIAVAKR